MKDDRSGRISSNGTMSNEVSIPKRRVELILPASTYDHVHLVPENTQLIKGLACPSMDVVGLLPCGSE